MTRDSPEIAQDDRPRSPEITRDRPRAILQVLHKCAEQQLRTVERLGCVAWKSAWLRVQTKRAVSRKDFAPGRSCDSTRCDVFAGISGSSFSSSSSSATSPFKSSTPQSSSANSSVIIRPPPRTRRNQQRSNCGDNNASSAVAALKSKNNFSVIRPTAAPPEPPPPQLPLR